MEQAPRQFEMWPEKKNLTIEEINELSRKAGDYGQKKNEDLVSKEEATRALEGEKAKPFKIGTFKENIKRVQEIIEKLKGRA